MTVAKSLQRKEVERVWVALERAFRAECPDVPDMFYLDPSTIPRPSSKRGVALWEAYRLAWSASARFRRRTEKKRATKRGQGAAFFDDKLVDKAIENMQRAQAAMRNATAFLEKAAERLERETVRIGFNKAFVKTERAKIEAAERIETDLELLVGEITTFNGVPQARTQGQWDRFISSSAAKLLDAGFSSREVAGLLTGLPAEEIDRPTLEKFRQRVRRHQISMA